ncbi:MAG: AraC family transcriptional regulator, partial [Paenibacillus sp.]|nr:AraC family transcriptional regulator [Paenibacillus sp.]
MMRDPMYGLSRFVRLDVKWARRHAGLSNKQEHDHYNPFFELLAVYEGPVYLQAGQEKLELQSGEVFLLMPWETHRKWKMIPDTAGFFWVQFTADPPLCPIEHGRILEDELKMKQLRQQDLRTAEEIDQELLWIPRRFQLGRRFELLHLMEKLLDTQNEPNGYFRYASASLLNQILGHIAEAYLRQSGLDKKIPDTYITYRNVVTYLDEYFR